MPEKSILEQLIKETNKKFKANIVNHGVHYEALNKIPFSSPRINYMLYGGLPLGRLIEFSGDEGSGKTTTALDITSQAQKLFPERKVMYIDCENTLDEAWARLLGVDTKQLILLQPDTETAEQIFEIALSFIESDEISLVVIDSLGVMLSGQAYEKTMEEKTYGGIAMALTLFSKKAIPLLAKHKCTLIGINQMRDDMNSRYGGTTTTGGRGWKHNCSIRMEFRQSDFIDDKGASVSRGTENPAGHLVKCTLAKTKVCKPDRKIGFYTLKYLDGIDYISDTIDVAIKEGIIHQGGAWYTLVNTETGELLEAEEGKQVKFQGRAKLRDYLYENPKLFSTITEQINLKIL